MKTKLESPFSVHDIVKYKYQVKEIKEPEHLVQLFYEVIEIEIRQCYSAIQVFLTVRTIQYEAAFKSRYELTFDEKKKSGLKGGVVIKRTDMRPHNEYIKLRADEVIDASAEFKKLIK